MAFCGLLLKNFHILKLHFVHLLGYPVWTILHHLVSQNGSLKETMLKPATKQSVELQVFGAERPTALKFQALVLKSSGPSTVSFLRN